MGGARRSAGAGAVAAHDPARRRPRGGRGRELAPVLFETNATGLAGLYNHAAGVRILRTEVFPRVYATARRAALFDPPDLLALVVRWVRPAARRPAHPARGRVLGRPTVRRLQRGPATRRGVPRRRYPRRAGTVTDLRRVRTDSGSGTCPSTSSTETSASRNRAAPPRTLAAFVDCFDAGATLPGARRRVQPQGAPRVPGAPGARVPFHAAERRFSAGSCRGRACSTRGSPRTRPAAVDLPEFVRRARARLLIKPNVGSSGAGVLLGREAGPARWEARIDRALREPGDGSSRRAARDAAIDGLPARRAPTWAALLLPRSLLRARRTRAPPPREPRARRQRGAAGRGRLRVPGEPVARPGGTRRAAARAGEAGAGRFAGGRRAGRYFISIFLAMAT